MTRISAATLRQTNPKIRIQVACDYESFDSLKSSSSKLFSECDEISPFQTPLGSDLFRNRYIKTQLKSLVKGSFLFLDSDTVIKKNLDSIQAISSLSDIAAAPNRSHDDLMSQIWSEDQRNLDDLSWPINKTYFNGGVIFYQDTPGANAFSENWHRNWLNGVKATGRLKDQPSFNYTIMQLETKVEKLPHHFNCQFRTNPKLALDACIWHYYSSIVENPLTEFDYALKFVDAAQQIPEKIVNKLVQSKYPWRDRSPVDRWLAQRIVRNGVISTPEALWFGGRYPKAISAKFKKMARTLLG